MSRFFIDRPNFAWVLSIIIVIAGGVCYQTLPTAQYPPIVPPTIQVIAVYPGGNAQTVADSVAEPIEAQVNGVEGMIYMSSTSTNNGQYNLIVSFEVGTDVNTALMLVQTRVQLALAQLPVSVQEQGVSVKLKSANMLLAINLISPDDRYDSLYLSNYAQINVFDPISRVPGVGMAKFLGERSYSMRAWLEPQKLAALDMTAGDVVDAIRQQNVDVAAGNIGQEPVPSGQEFQLVLNTVGRLSTVEQFEKIVVKVGTGGKLVYLSDVARVELGSQNSDLSCTLTVRKDEKLVQYPSVALGVYTTPTANALATGDAVKAKMEELKAQFPQGVDYVIAYDTTPFIRDSVNDVINTIYIAAGLVIVVILVFLQDWRAMLLPMIDIVVALIGTFMVMKMLGFSLNNLSLFGLVLAVGIVVDDSIVVVENIERWMGKGLPAREATLKAMAEITGPVFGISLVLASVFIPTAFVPGLVGEFYRQFALTIATAALFSATNALTMAPARAVAWIKPHGGENAVEREALPRAGIAVLFGVLSYYLLQNWAADFVPPTDDEYMRWAVRAALFLPGAVVGWLIGPLLNRILAVIFGAFNKVFDLFTNGYTRIVGLSLRLCIIVLIIYAGLLGLTGYGLKTAPKGFIPSQDQGYVLVNVVLPDSASVQRTEATMKKLEEIALDTPGVESAMSVSGFSVVLACDASNWGTIFVILDEFKNRTTPDTQAVGIIKALNERYYKEVINCEARVLGAPPVPGLGGAGGLQIQIEDRTGQGLQELQDVTESIVSQAHAQPEIGMMLSTFKADAPQLAVDIDREAVMQMGVKLQDVNETLSANMGSMYVNQFNRFGRIWQVNVEAEGKFRTNPENLKLLQVRNEQGDMVPLGALINVHYVNGPTFVMRYNDVNSSSLIFGPGPGESAGQAMAKMEQICSPDNLPGGFGYEWTGIAYQAVTASNTGSLIFALSLVLVFLVLVALYESWSLPVGIVLVVPMCLLSSVAGLVWIAHKPVDIFAQIGFIVLIAMAAKNAILIVEYAVDQRAEGLGRREATLLACKLRLRPILMTSFAFVFGVLPLMIATGAGWEMRRSLGTAVFSGMIGVTFFGVFLTPVFYYVISWFAERNSPPPSSTPGNDDQSDLTPPASDSVT